MNQSQEKIIEYHKKLLNQGRIFNQIQLTKVSPQPFGYAFMLNVSNNEIQKINTFLFINPSYQFPQNLKKRLEQEFLSNDLSLPQMNHLKKEIEKLAPHFGSVRIAPVIINRKTGLKVYYDNHRKNQLEGEINSFFANNKTQTQGFINLELYNALKQGEGLNLFWKKDNSGQEVNIGGNFPYIFGSAYYINAHYHLKQYIQSDQLTNYNIEAGYIHFPFKIGFTYQDIQNKDLPSSRLMGAKANYLFSNNPLKKFYIYKKFSLEFSYKLNDKKNTLLLINSSYPIKIKENYYLLFNAVYLQNSQSEFSTPLYLKSYQVDYNTSENSFVGFKYLNLKAIIAQKKSLFYFTTSYIQAHTNTKHTILEAGIGLSSLGKNQLLNVEFVYSNTSSNSLVDKGLKIKINHKINL
jgi:hypothetical protein